MKLTVKRTALISSYTLGELYIDGQFFCSTLEDKDRGLTQNMSVEQIKSMKVPGETAIPKGTYKVTLDVVSPKQMFQRNVISQRKGQLKGCPLNSEQKLTNILGLLIHLPVQTGISCW